MKRGDRVRFKKTGDVFTYAGIDGTCAKMMHGVDPCPHPVRMWHVHECFEHEDGTPIPDGWWNSRV